LVVDDCFRKTSRTHLHDRGRSLPEGQLSRVSGRRDEPKAQHLERHRGTPPRADRRSVLKSDGLCIQVCNAANDTITACEPIAGFLARYCPGTPVTPALREFEAPPSSREIREVPGFREQHDWRRYVPKSHGRMQRGTEAR